MLSNSGVGRAWTVLFIGGATACGKSTVATQLGDLFGARVLEVDLFNQVIDRVLPTDHNPAFQLLGREEVWQLPPEQVRDRIFQASAFVCNALEVVVADRLSTRQPAIIEGVWLLPSFVQQQSYASVQNVRPSIQNKPGDCRALFLVEPELEEMERRLEERYYEGWLASNPGNAAGNHAYGLEVARQARDLGIPVLESRPFNTLLDRAVAALS